MVTGRDCFWRHRSTDDSRVNLRTARIAKRIVAAGRLARPAWLLACLTSLASSVGCNPTRDLLGTIASPVSDGGGDARVLVPFRFTAPTLVPALSDPSADDEDPSFTGDRRELYFSSTRSSPNSDIWVSHRLTPADPWGPPTLVSELSSSGIDRSPSVSFD